MGAVRYYVHVYKGVIVRHIYESNDGAFLHRDGWFFDGIVGERILCIMETCLQYVQGDQIELGPMKMKST